MAFLPNKFQGVGEQCMRMRVDECVGVIFVVVVVGVVWFCTSSKLALIQRKTSCFHFQFGIQIYIHRETNNGVCSYSRKKNFPPQKPAQNKVRNRDTLFIPLTHSLQFSFSTTKCFHLPNIR